MELLCNLITIFAIFFLINISTISTQSVKLITSNITELEEYIQQTKQLVKPRFRQKYHISAPVGWINDPNGFSYFNGEYHVFYQFHPYSALWGPMHWGHVKSKNLVDWEYLPTALIPGDDFDKDGCFSGSAIEHDGKLVLMYTGHIENVESGNYQVQNLAYSRDGKIFGKFHSNPVIAKGPNDVKDFRDPKVWKNDGTFYTVLGNATPDKRGRAVLYKSTDLIDWQYLGVLAESDGSLGYMWECPDFINLNGKYVLLISPQGMETFGERYKNLHQTGYLVGTFDYHTNKFNVESLFEELDYGHDFYASQTLETPDGRRIVIGWLDMWESNFREQEDMWAGTLSLPRELTLSSEGKVLMNPIRELINLRDGLLINKIIEPGDSIQLVANNVEIIANIIKSQSNVYGIDFWISESESIKLFFNASEKMVTLDRGGGDDGIRKIQWTPIENTFKIYLDSSSIEVFCGNGEVVLSSRIYPSQNIKLEIVGATTSLEIYALRQSV